MIWSSYLTLDIGELKNSLTSLHINIHLYTILICLTLYDPGGGGFKSPPPPPIFCSHAFNFRAALLCVSDFSQKIV